MKILKKIYKSIINFEKINNEYDYVYCKAGVSRAPSIVVIYLASILNYDLKEAIKFGK